MAAEMGEEEDKVASLCTIVLEKPPCCLAFSPLHPEILVVGSYNLQSQPDASDIKEESVESPTPQRDGSLTVYRIHGDQIIHVQTVDDTDGAILDLHFHHNHVVTCTSLGNIVIYRLTVPPDEDGRPSLHRICSLQVDEPDVLITSFAIEPFVAGTRLQNDTTLIAFTTTTGNLNLVAVPNHFFANIPALEQDMDDLRHRIQPLFTHTLEAWICVFAPLSWHIQKDHSVFSGGDDSLLNYMCLGSHTAAVADPDPPSNQDNPIYHAVTSIINDRRIHGAGVTIVLPLPLPPKSVPKEEPRFVLTGSYDDRLRLLAIPPTSSALAPVRPKVLGELDLGGGVWRIKILEQTFDYANIGKTETAPSANSPSEAGGKQALRTHLRLLVACMYAGACVVKLNFGHRPDEAGQYGCEINVLGRFHGHESMCYGVDVQSTADDGVGDGGGEKDVGGTALVRTIVSCSFYDRRLCLWRF